MAWNQVDTGFGTFSNPVAAYSDGERLYLATLQSSPRRVCVYAWAGEDTPAVQVAVLDVHAQTQSIGLTGHKGELIAATIVLDTTDGSRILKPHKTGVMLAAAPPPAPAPVPPNTAIGMIRYHLESIEELVRTLEG